MPSRRRKPAQAERSHSERAAHGRPKERPRLRAVEGRASHVDELFSGRVSRAPAKGPKAKRKARPTEKLPDELGKLSDVYAAGKTLQREFSFKVRFAEEQVKDYCLTRFAEIYARGGKRPPSIEYMGDHSRFLFTQTNRTTLTLDKVEELRAMKLNIDEHTELRGLRVNFEAVRRHGLEAKLRDALSSMGLSKDILDECFVPNIELKETFYDMLDRIVSESLESGEKLEDKLLETIKILRPANQIRNLELPGYDARRSFDLVMKTEIAVPELPDEEEMEDVA